MKVQLTTLQLTAIIGFVVIGLLGGGGYYYISTKLDDAQTALSTLSGERDQLLQAPIAPSSLNIRGLNDNIKLLQSSLASLTPRLISPESKLAQVVQKNPVDFKQDLAAEQKQLTDLAREQSIILPPNFSFAFGRYNSLPPIDKDTVFLGKQLLAIHELTTILYASKIDEILSEKRTFDEVIRDGSSSELSDDSKEEALNGRSVTVAEGIYTVYPFELVFKTKPSGLRDFLNKLLASPYIFVVRSVQISSPNHEPLHLSDLAREAQSNVTNQAADAPPQPPFYAFGTESIEVTLRVDLVEWVGVESALASPSTRGLKHLKPQ